MGTRSYEGKQVYIGLDFHREFFVASCICDGVVVKNHSVARCVTIYSEDREKIALSTRSNERRQAPGSSVNFKEETYNNGDFEIRRPADSSGTPQTSA
jgi:hypothetical protein